MKSRGGHKRIDMDTSVGRFGHEVSGMESISHEEADRRFDEGFNGRGVFRKFWGSPYTLTAAGGAFGFVIYCGIKHYEEISNFVSNLF